MRSITRLLFRSCHASSTTPRAINSTITLAT
jgi:hypothetical protein